MSSLWVVIFTFSRCRLSILAAHMCYNRYVPDYVLQAIWHSVMPIRRTYKYRLLPTSRQARLLQYNLDLCRELYNACLQHRRDAYRMALKSISFAEQSAALVECKQVRPDLADVYSQTLQDVLHRVDKTFKAFFHRGGYPRFRGRYVYDSFTYPQSGWSVHSPSSERSRMGRFTLSKIGTLKLRLHRPVCGKVKTVTIQREGHDGKRWYACFSVEYEFEPPIHSGSGGSGGSAVGIDVGLEHFANLSNGEQVDNPRYFRKGEKRLAKQQRQLAKAIRTHPKRKEYRRRVATAHRKVRNQRTDFLHKLSARLVQTYSVIAVEKLNIRGLAAGMLAKSVNDAGWSTFISMLRYKAESAGAQLVEVDPRLTSQTCPQCGTIRKKELSERWHRCANCGTECHRDIAAALVILARGLASIGSQPLEAAAL
jgi:putative transposase